MDRAVHRRPGWTAHSPWPRDRIAYYEMRQRREPARLAHRRRNALLVGRRRTATSTRDAFWPTVDPYRLPGTTVSTKRAGRRRGRRAGARPSPPRAGSAAPPTASTPRSASTSAASAPPCRPRSPGSASPTRSSASAPASPAPTAYRSRRSSTTATSGRRHARPHRRRRRPARDTGGPRPSPAHLGPSPATAARSSPAAPACKALREDRTGAWRDINTGSSTGPRSPAATSPSGSTTAPTRRDAGVRLPPHARARPPRSLAARAADRRWLTVLANTAARQAVAVPPSASRPRTSGSPARRARSPRARPASVLRAGPAGRTATLCDRSEPPRTGAAAGDHLGRAGARRCRPHGRDGRGARHRPCAAAARHPGGTGCATAPL